MDVFGSRAWFSPYLTHRYRQRFQVELSVANHRSLFIPLTGKTVIFLIGSGESSYRLPPCQVPKEHGIYFRESVPKGLTAIPGTLSYLSHQLAVDGECTLQATTTGTSLHDLSLCVTSARTPGYFFVP